MNIKEKMLAELFNRAQGGMYDINSADDRYYVFLQLFHL